MGSRKRSRSNDADMLALHKEWDEASCPICMDHPHNAVLLLCSSHNKGCRPYICDTSYRHSNCFDRFRKITDENREDHTSLNLNPRNHHRFDNVSNVNWSLGAPGGNTETQGDQILVVDSSAVVRSGRGRAEGGHVRNLHIGMVEETIRVPGSAARLEVHSPEDNYSQNSFMSNLRCPMCRGSILGCKVVEKSRRYLDLKQRSCSHESCLFCGSYSELRRHARKVHPDVRPADVDLSRQRAWKHLESRREYDDVVGAIHSAMPGAIVVGDYVIEDGDMPSEDRERSPGENERSLSSFYLFEMIDSVDSVAESRTGGSRTISRQHHYPRGGFSSSRTISRQHHYPRGGFSSSRTISRQNHYPRGGFSSSRTISRQHHYPRGFSSQSRRYQWGERLLGIQDVDTVEDDDVEA